MYTRPLIAVAILWLIPIQASAQAAPPPAREVSAEFSFVGTSGNSSTQSIGVGGAFIQRLDSSWELTTKTAYIRNDSDAVLKAESFALTFGGARVLNPRLSLFVRHGYLRDRFAGIINRNAPEGGVSYTAVNTAPHKLVVDVGLGYAKEERVAGLDQSNGTGGVGALYTLKFSDNAEFSDDWRSVVSLDQIRDRRFANIASISAKLTTIFSLKVSNTIRFVNVPTVGFEKTDAITAIALVAKF